MGTVNPVHPDHRLTLQIIFYETEESRGSSVLHMELAQGMHGRTGVLLHVSVHTPHI